jgi:selenocysteine-specific translation elongation factor
MTVTSVFSIRGRGVVVTGTIDEGTVRLGDEVRIDESPVRVGGIEVSREAVNEAHAGQDVGLLLSDVDKSRVKRGDVIAGQGYAW